MWLNTSAFAISVHDLKYPGDPPVLSTFLVMETIRGMSSQWTSTVSGLTPSLLRSPGGERELFRYLRGRAVKLPANRDQFMIQLDRPEPLGARRRSPTLHRASKEAQNGPLVARVCV